ncbi:MAG: hypothetical protein IIW40_01705 [Clostridia bacterium]|nr:hypothetical protein [Clostridia bacterium]
MKAELIGENSLRVWLSAKELTQWGLGRAESRTYTRQGVRQLIRYVQESAGYGPVKRLSAELFPVDGGAVLLLSPYRTGGGRCWPLVYYIENEDDLFSLAEQWTALPAKAPPGTALYVYGQGYGVAVYPVETPTEGHRRLLEEYGRLMGRGEAAAAVCAEHGRLLAAGDGLTRLLGR